MAVEDWTVREIDAAAASYFAMLSNEMAGLPYNKAERNRALQVEIARNPGAIEFKHHFAVMLGLGQPWIKGYKPAANFQNALVDGVLRWLDAHDDWLRPRTSPHRITEIGARPAPLHGPALERLIEYCAAPSQRNEPPPIDPKSMAAISRKFDVAARDARNRALGRAGEEAVFVEEQRLLRAAGREDLARKAQWTS